jgi:tetratricopeptide (TPR) repeat protein
MQCIDGYYHLLKGVPAEPILFRVLGLIKIGISDAPVISDEINSKIKIFASIIKILDHYMPAVKNNPLIHYYYGLILYQLERFKEASDELEKCLKISDECSWKFLYVKGAIEIKNKAYKDAVREFSAGLIVEERAELYLGRCISYLLLFDETHCEQHPFMEKSFEDLQKFIEIEEDKTKISKWVTKILFYNRAYE